jgi:ferredoxin
VPGSSYTGYIQTEPAPSIHDSGSYGGAGYGNASPSSTGSYGTHAAAGDAEPYAGYGGQSTEDPYGARASYYDTGPPAVSTPDSAVSEPFLAPPAYERAADRYRSIPAVSNPNRPPPGEYGLRSAEPPMTDYLTREPIPEPPSLVPVPAPVPVRPPTTPIPSAARSRKAPKEPPGPPVNRAGRLRMRVNPVACDGHGLCAELLPEIVSLDDWGYPMPVVAEVPTELEGHAQRAAQQCPTLAIILERRQPRSR